MYNDNILIAKFRKEIQQLIDDKRFSISNGNVEDILTYKEMCAQVIGLEVALVHFNAIVRTLGEDGDTE